MDLRCILVAMTSLYLTWIFIVLVGIHVVSHLGHVSKCKMCCRNFAMLEKFRHFDLFLGTTPYSIEVLCLSFPYSHHTLGGILLHLNLITIMLWDRYSLVSSIPSEFTLWKWKKKIIPLQFFLVLSGLCSFYMWKWRFHHSFPSLKGCYPLNTTFYFYKNHGAQVLMAKKEYSRGSRSFPL